MGSQKVSQNGVITPETLVYYYHCFGCGSYHANREDADNCCPKTEGISNRNSIRCLQPARSAPEVALEGKIILDQSSLNDFAEQGGGAEARHV